MFDSGFNSLDNLLKTRSVGFESVKSEDIYS